MTVPETLWVYGTEKKTRGIVPIRFRRCKDTKYEHKTFAHPKCPDLDDRGFLGPEKAPVLGITAAKGDDRVPETVFVALYREAIADDAPLYVTSSAPKVVEVASPAAGAALATGAAVAIKLKGVPRAGKELEPRTARIEVRYGGGTAKDPIIAELAVRVYDPLVVKVQPHNVKIGQKKDAKKAAVGSATDIPAVIALAQAAWLPCGILFDIQPTKDQKIDLEKAGQVNDKETPGECGPIVDGFFEKGAVNIYFVKTFLPESGRGGYGWGPSTYKKRGFKHTGVVIVDQAGGVGTDPPVVQTLAGMAATIAHEVGHFLGLQHPENREIDLGDPRADTWSRRMLMYPSSAITKLDTFKKPDPAIKSKAPDLYKEVLKEYEDAGGTWRDDVGHGDRKRGMLITQKHVPKLRTDDECMTARRTIATGDPYGD